MQIFFLVFAVALAMTLWGRRRFRSIYDEESANVISSRLTGQDIARKILARRGITDVEVVKGRGILQDFYHPERKRITLAPQHFGGSTYSALGIAANLAGHAIQHHENHRPFQWRVSAIRATVYLSLPLVILSLGALLAGMNKTILPALLMIWAIIAVTNFMTIPTELDATERAKRQLDGSGLFRNLDERLGVERVMGASSTMYIDGLFTFLSWLAAILIPWAKKNMTPEADS